MGNGKQAWKLAGKMTLYKQATKWMLPLNRVEGQLLTSIVSISTLAKFYYTIFYLNSNLYVKILLLLYSVAMVTYNLQNMFTNKGPFFKCKYWFTDKELQYQSFKVEARKHFGNCCTESSSELVVLTIKIKILRLNGCSGCLFENTVQYLY